MRLVVLGSGTGIPSPLRGSSSYLVETDDDRSMLWDCGPGTMQRLVSRGHDWKRVDHIFLTHLHPDHCADLVAFLFASNWEVARRAECPLRIIGPKGVARFVQGLHDLYPGLSWQHAEPRIDEWDGGGTLVGPHWRVSGLPVDHADLDALALRLESSGRTLVYSGDTGESDRIVTAARGAHTLLVECSFPDEIAGIRSHLTAGGTGRVAAAAGVKRAVLTHFYPECDGVDLKAQCAAAFGGDIVLAYDGLVLEL